MADDVIGRRMQSVPGETTVDEELNARDVVAVVRETRRRSAVLTRRSWIAPWRVEDARKRI
jgi:hypothetical protein